MPRDAADPVKTKVIGVGLNKTGTKSLRSCLHEWGYRHRTCDADAFDRFRAGGTDELLDEMADYDSFEDWPWPLMYREIDERYPDARFVLTVRSDPDVWFRSLCKMAVRMGPLDTFERHIYGESMPQGHRARHIDFYEAHNQSVRDHFADRPGKLLEWCWDSAETSDELAQFLGEPTLGRSPHINVSDPVYDGDSRIVAHVNRLLYTPYAFARRMLRGLFKRIRR